MVFDNADDVAVVRPFWPKSVRGSIIVTSRNPWDRGEGLSAHGIELRPFEADQGQAFLLSFLNISKDVGVLAPEMEAIHTLHDTFSGLALGLKVAAAFINQKHYSPSEFVRLYRRRNEVVDIVGVPGTEKTLETLWDVSIDSITSDATEILNTLAFLDPDRVPLDLFLDPDLDPDSSDYDLAMCKLHDALGSLTTHSLVQVNTVTRSLSLHRYFQSVIRKRAMATTALYQTAIGKAVALLRRRVPRTGFGAHRHPEFWTVRREYAAHVDFMQSQDFRGLSSTILSQMLSLICDHG
jgi:hypothetical protein